MNVVLSQKQQNMNYKDDRPKIVLSSNIPLVELYDLNYGSKIGKLLDGLKEVGCEVELLGVSQYNLMFPDKDNFMISLNGCVHKTGSAMYGSCGGRANTKIEALKNFIQELFSKIEQGYLVCKSSSSSAPLYRIILTDDDVKLEEYKPQAAT